MRSTLPPVHDGHLPLAERQFPYRAATTAEQPAVDAAIGVVLTSVDRMLHKLARDRLPPSTSRADLEDAVQDTRIHLWRYALPRFDRTRRTAVTTWCFECSRNFLRDAARRIKRERQRRPQKLPVLLAAPDNGNDRAIQALAERVHQQPEQFMSRTQAEVFRAVEGRGDRQIRDVARDFGYAQASSVSILRVRAVAGLRELAARTL